MKTGKPIQDIVSTGDLNRGRRVKPRLLFGSFCRSKKNKPVSLSGAFHCMESMPLSGQHASRAFTPFLLETWSPCSHPFAILPVSAVSDAQKLATGNFLHVRAGSFEVLQTSNQLTAKAVSHRPLRGIPNRRQTMLYLRKSLFYAILSVFFQHHWFSEVLMKKISASAVGFSFAGCFLGVGCMSGSEVYQFFGTFGRIGFLGVLAAVTGLSLLNFCIAYIVRKTGDARIDHAVVGAPNNFLLTLTGALETLIFFGTYVVTAAGAGALLEMLTGFRGAHIWGAFLFCAVISFITIRGIKGLVHLFSAVVPILVFMAFIVSVVTVIKNPGGFDFTPSEKIHPFIPNAACGALTFTSYNIFCSIGVLCPVGLQAKSRKSVVLGTVFGALLLIVQMVCVLLALAATPGASAESLPMLAVARQLSPVLSYFYAALLFFSMAGASLACLIPTITYFADHSKFLCGHSALLTFTLSLVAFLFSCFGFADLVGTLFSSFGYVALAAVFGIVFHAARIKLAK